MANFSNVNANYVNKQSLGIELAKNVKENFFQNIICKAGEACDEAYVDNTELVTILINRQLPFNMPARRIGSTINGGFFHNNPFVETEGDQYELNMNIVMDFCVPVSANLESMTPIPIMQNVVKNLGGNLNQEINASTIAEQLRANLVANGQKKIDNLVVVDKTVDGYAIDGIEDATAILNEGNPQMGIDTYPQNRRAYYIRSRYAAALRKVKGFLMLNSDYGQTMRESGGLDKDTNPDTITGVYGRINGTPVYLIADVTWSNAASYLGLPGNAFDKIHAILVSATGTARGLAFANNMKIVDAIQGQGLIAQPKYRWGVDNLDPASIVCIVDKDFINPFEHYNAILQPVGSRTFANTNVSVEVDATAATRTADILFKNPRYINPSEGNIIFSGKATADKTAISISNLPADQNFVLTTVKGENVDAANVPSKEKENKYYLWLFGKNDNNLIAATRCNLVLTK